MRMRSLLLAVVTTVAVALTGGCATPAALSAADSTPTKSTLTREQAAATYLTAVAPLNRVISELAAETRKPHPDMTRIHAIAARGETMARHLLDVLTGTAWPTDVQASADALARDVASAITYYTVLKTAKDRAHFPPDLVDRGSAQLFRAKLGLPVIAAS